MFSSRSLLLGSIIALVGSFLLVQGTYAAVCSVSVDEVITQGYVDENECDSIEIAGSVSTTWVGVVDLEGGTVTVKTGSVMTMGSSSQMILGANDDFIIEANATATHLLEDMNGLQISARNVTITGVLSASAKGCRRAAASGADGYGLDISTGLCAEKKGGYGRGGGGSGLGGGGGSYGGLGGGGGPSAAAGDVIYGDSLIPNLPGSGGGTGYYASAFGGAGGGIIHVTSTGTLTVNGSITASGGNGTYQGLLNAGGGGAGGSVVIRAGTLAGAGTISVNGGNGGAGGGGGGSGKVAVYYDTLSGPFSLAQVTAAGGLGGVGGAWGTGVDGQSGMTYFLNRFTDDGTGTITVTEGFDFPSAGDYTRDSFSFSSGVALGCATSSALTVSSTEWLVFDSVTWTCPSTIDAVTIASDAGISTTGTSVTFSTATSVDIVAPTWTNVTTTISLSRSGARSTWDISSDLTLRNLRFSTYDAGTTDASGGTLFLPRSIGLTMVSSTISSNVSSTSLTTLSIDALSSIDASARGCPRSVGAYNGSGPDPVSGVCAMNTAGYGIGGGGTGQGGTGAAHAGVGGDGSGLAGSTATYGSSTNPLAYGSSGGGGYYINTAPSGAGGGIVYLVVSGVVTVDGSIKADGGVGVYGGSWTGGGGGAGGSINLTLGSLAGSGSITANGGAGANGGGGGGGGGGGRIAMRYSAFSFSGTSSTSAGAAGTGGSGVAGGEGTIYTLQLNVSPDVPSLLGPDALVNGSVTGTVTPIFTFTLSDGDIADTVKYRIQIDDSEDFASIIVDYTSALAAQGAVSFQVGQSEGTGAYSVGSADQALSDGSYYWRVKTIDGIGTESSYSTANAGAVAFTVDSATRLLSFLSESVSDLESVTATSVRIVLSATHFETVTVNYAVTGGTAEGSGTDYTLASGTATIAPGETSATVPLTVVNDVIDEPAETIIVTLSSPSFATIGSNTSTTYTITDDDEAGVTVTELDGSTTTTEDGVTDTYTVVLTSEPTSTVQIIFATSTYGVTLSTSTITFTASDWNVAQTVTVSATDDSVYEGTHSASVVSTVSSTDYGYPSLSLTDVVVTITDNDTAGVTVSAVTGSAVEGGASASYTLTLTSQPTSTVTLVLTGDAVVGTLSTSSIIFTSDNWNTPQTMTVSAVDDAIDEPEDTLLVSHSVSSDFSLGYDIATVISAASVSVIDDDEAGVTFTESGGSTTTTEDGITDTYTTVLTSEPTSTVQIIFTTSTNGVNLSTSTLTFTSANWNVPQTVTVTAEDDAIYEDTHTSIVSSAVSSASYAYPLLSLSDLSVTITDNDAAGVTVSAVTGSAIEGGETATYTAVLISQPTSTVTLVLAGNALLASLSTSSIAFTSLNWNVPQTITVSAVDDAIDEPEATLTVSHTVSSSFSLGYDVALVINSSDITITDNDVAGVTLTESGGSTTTTEDGITDTYAVVLTSEPTSTVQIVFATSTYGVTLSTSTITFTSVDWNVPQTVTVSATDDLVYEGTHSASVVSTVSSTDYGYPSLSLTDVAVTITDNDAAGVTVSAVSGPAIEGGATATYTAVLLSQPTSTVTLVLAGDALLGTLSTSSIAFTSDNWNAPQTITISAVDDAIDEPEATLTVSHTVSSSFSLGYDVALVISSSDIAITDNDVAGVTFAESGGSTTTTEDGVTDTYTAVLTSEPTSTVQIIFTTSTNGVILSTSTLTFTSANWNVPQTVTVTAEDDAIYEDAHTSIVSSVVSSASYAYPSLSLADLSVTITDNDTAGVTVSAVTGSAVEGGASASYTLTLTSQPTSTVTLVLTGDDLVGSLSTSSIIFTSDNWNTPQTMTVSAVDDAIDEPEDTLLVSHSVSSDFSLGYNLATVISAASVSVIDDDEAGVTFTESGGSTTTTEDGVTDAYTVVLTSEPTSTVQIIFTTSTYGVTLSTSTITFTSVDWNVPQTVTVSATDDLVYEGTHISTAVPSVSSTDYGYPSLVLSPVSVTITDNDSASVTVSAVSGTAVEGGASASYTLVLTSQPTSTVTVTLAGETKIVSLSTNSIAFTSSNWNDPQTITVSAVDDTIVEATHLTYVGHSATSGALGYEGVTIASAPISVIDNDVAPAGGGGGGGGGGAGSGGGTGTGGGESSTSDGSAPVAEESPTSTEVIPLPDVIASTSTTPSATSTADTLVTTSTTPLVETVSSTSPVISPETPPLALDVAPALPLTAHTDGSRQEAAEDRGLQGIREDAASFRTRFTSSTEVEASRFIAYGLSTTTQRLGEGERRAVLRDYLDTQRRDDIAWDDVHRMSEGQIPKGRNLAQERLQVASVVTLFLRVYGHTPRFQDAEENLAWNVLMYRIRFPRDLGLEGNGLREFRDLMRRNPSSPLDWSLVRVLGYVNT